MSNPKRRTTAEQPRTFNSGTWFLYNFGSTLRCCDVERSAPQGPKDRLLFEAPQNVKLKPLACGYWVRAELAA